MDISQCDELYVIEGDVFFEKSVLDRLISSLSDNATILEPYNINLEGTFVELGENGFVRDWRHKSEQEEGYRLDDKYKTVNLHKFSIGFVDSILNHELDKRLADGGEKLPIEKIMRNIVTDNTQLIRGEILHGEKWFEIDDIHDLQIAEKIFGNK
jgi:choline kinase